MSVIYKPSAIPVKISKTTEGPDGKTKIDVKLSDPTTAKADAKAPKVNAPDAKADGDKPKKGKAKS